LHFLQQRCAAGLFFNRRVSGGFIYETSDLRDKKRYSRVLGIRDAAEEWDGCNAVVDVIK
jgi:hypothetical protein